MTDAIILITGASAGIGAACVEAFVAAGARVIASARRMDALAARAHRLGEDRVRPLALDVRDADGIEAALAGLPEEWRDIEVLVNNAGMARGLKPVYEQTPAEIDEMIDTNVRGLLFVTRAVVPGMLVRGRGHVINIGSIAGQQVYAGGTVYCATKFAVDAITKGLKLDLHGTPVRVSTVDPGLVETEFSLVRFEGDRDRADRVYTTTTPLAPSDVAEAVVFCATRPAHVNIAQVVVFPTAQSAVTTIVRQS
jgi:3-hydroxy acid dehydrogenase / malonic semialdehyde reductase